MDIIRTFSYKIKALFSILKKEQGKPPLPNPPPALLAHLLPVSTSNAKYLLHERNLRAKLIGIN